MLCAEDKTFSLLVHLSLLAEKGLELGGPWSDHCRLDARLRSRSRTPPRSYR
jgi:hypothetical protein